MPPRRRLNLFAIPAETNALFSMLILASITLSLFSGSVIRFYSGIQDPVSAVDITSQRLEISYAFLPVTCLSGVAALGTLCLAFLFYVRHPSQIRKRRNLQSLTEKDRPVQDHIAKLALQAGVDVPTVEMPLHGLKGSDAQAFGVGKGRIVALDGGLRVLRKTKPAIFDALIRHELAHFANADIGRSYFSDALWKSIRWLLVFPFLFALTAILIEGFLRGIFDPSQLELAIAAIPDVLVLFIQWGVVLVVTGMIWARLLKTREFYADWRAALWGSQKGLQIIFQEEIEKARSKARIFFWRFHPDARERLDVLEHTDTLFKLSPAMILLAGLLLSLIFAGLTFSFAAFIVFAEYILTLRDLSSGLFYWVLTGIWWSGFAVLILLVFGLTGWLVNNILLPQIQKQAVWELLHKQSGWVHYIRLGIPALILIIGIELGFFITPFSQLAPNDMVWFLIELFIILPVLASLAWWYLIYIKFIASRVSATEIGTSFSAGRRRFLGTASVVWVFLFFMPGLLLSRFIDLGFPYFLYFNISWLIFTLLFSPLVFGATLAAIKFFFDNPPKRCPHCGNITGHAAPAIELCEHCGGVLGEWLFVPESS